MTAKIVSNSNKTCIVDGCESIVLAKNLCSKHYKRQQIHGSTDARKRSPGTLKERFWRMVDVRSDDECWLWSGSTYGKNGYGSIMLEDQSSSTAHRVSYEIHFGEIEKELCVLHKCDVRKCVNPNHLFLGTHQDNSSDMVNKKRNKFGSDHHCSVLTESNVINARKEYDSGAIIADLARRYKVMHTTMWYVIKRKTWRHI